MIPFIFAFAWSVVLAERKGLVQRFTYLFIMVACCAEPRRCGGAKEKKEEIVSPLVGWLAGCLI